MMTILWVLALYSTLWGSGAPQRFKDVFTKAMDIDPKPRNYLRQYDHNSGRRAIRYPGRVSSRQQSGNNEQVVEQIREQVELLQQEIQMAFLEFEDTFGFRVQNFTYAVNVARGEFSRLLRAWNQNAPSVVDFLFNVSNALDSAKIVTTLISNRVERINQIGQMLNDSSMPSDGNRRRRDIHNFKRTKNHGRHSSGRFYAGNRSQNHIRRKHLNANGKKSCRVGLNTSFSATDRRSDSKAATRQYRPWFSPLEQVAGNLSAAYTWYTFLQEFEKVLKGLDFHSGAISATGDFLGWSGSSEITQNNLQEALQRIKTQFQLISLEENIPILNATVNRARLEYLNEIIKVSLRVKTYCYKDGSAVSAVGAFVFMSEAVKCVSCNTTTFNVVATSRIFLDVDINATRINCGSTFNMSLLAPELITLGQRKTICVSGGSAPYVMDSNDGRPGLPGQNGGNLLAMFYQQTGGEVLIQSNGGNGGNGNTGGQNKLQIGCLSAPNYLNVYTICYGMYFCDGVTDKLSCIEKCKTYAAERQYCCNEYEKPGDLAYFRDGAGGGKPGMGGRPGNVLILLATGDTTRFQLEQKEGSPGKPGAGGKGSKTRTIPSDQELEAARFYFITPLTTFCSYDESQFHPSPDVVNGDPGANPRNATSPTSTNYSIGAHVSGVLQFKAASRVNSTIFTRPTLQNLTELLDKNLTFDMGYDTLSFVKEFIDLELQVSSLPTNYPVDIPYASVANRALLSANFTAANQLQDDTRVLQFLFSTALGKKSAITSPFEPALVVNIQGFLEAEINRVQQLQDSITQQLAEEQRFEQINQLNADYSSMVQMYIDQAMYFQENVLLPEVDAIENQIRNYTRFLLDEIERLKKQAEADQKELEKYRNQLQNQMIINGVFNGFKVLAESVNFAVPGLGSVIAGGIGVAQSLYQGLAGPTKPNVGTINLPRSVDDGNRKSALRLSQSTMGNLRGFQRQLDATNEFLQLYPDEFARPLRALQQINSTLSMASMDGNDMTPTFAPSANYEAFKMRLITQNYISVAQSNLTRLIDEALKTRRVKRQSGGGQNLTRQQVAETTTNMLKLTAEGFDALFKDLANIMEVSNQIQGLQRVIDRLNAQSKKVSEEMIPELDNMFMQLGDATANLGGQSKVTLDVLKWRIQSSIRDNKVEFKQQYTKDFQVEPYIDRGLSKLEEALNTLILLFQRVQDYQDQIRLANFTAQIQIASSSFLSDIADRELNDQFRMLKNLLQGQVVLKRLLLVSSAFRLYKFPMIDPPLCLVYQSVAPSLNFATERDLLAFFALVNQRLSGMLQTVKDDKILANTGSKYLFDYEFTHTRPSFPFYVWENSTKSQFIRSFLQGDSVQLFSDVTGNPNNVICDSVKFNRIDLYFTSVTGNKTLENEMATIPRKLLRYNEAPGCFVL